MCLYGYGLAFWFILMVIAIVNGVFRERLLRRSLDEIPAHVVSTLILTGIIVLAAAVFLLSFAQGESLGRLALLGLFWVVLTLAFEFLFGHYVDGQSWQKLLENYNLATGHVWPLVPLTLLVAPVVFGLVD